MSVATPVQTNFSTQDAATYKAYIDALFAVGYRFMTAFAPHEQSSPNMTVRLDAGFLFDGVTRTEVAAQSSATITSPVSNPRKDLVYIDKSTGAVGIVTGTEAASPAEPDCPAGKLPVCIVDLTTSTTSITNSKLTDRRAIWAAGLGAAAFLAIGAAANQAPTNAMLGAAAFREVIDVLAGAFGAADAGKAIVVGADGKYPVGSGANITNVPLGAPLYTSSLQAIVSSTGYKFDFTHGLGRAPVQTEVWIECTSADAGFAVGDRLHATSFLRGTGGIVIESGNTTTVSVVLSTDGPHFSAPNKGSTHARGDLNDNSWQLFVKCW